MGIQLVENIICMYTYIVYPVAETTCGLETWFNGWQNQNIVVWSQQVYKKNMFESGHNVVSWQFCQPFEMWYESYTYTEWQPMIDEQFYTCQNIFWMCPKLICQLNDSTAAFPLD